MCTVNYLTIREREEQFRVDQRLEELARDFRRMDRVLAPRGMEPLDYQGGSDTVEILVKDKDGKTKIHAYGWRKKRLKIAVWDSLDDRQKDAAINIHEFVKAMSGSELQAQDFTSCGLSRVELAGRMHLRMGRLIEADEAEHETAFRRWYDACSRRALNPEAALDYILREMGREAIARKRCLRSSNVKSNLLLCLDVRCCQAGTKQWPTAERKAA